MQKMDFQKEDIRVPGEHDVMFGRGGGTNNHSGNIKFRQLCHEHKFKYLAASKVDKPKVAREVVSIWRSLVPPGRFLTKAARDKSKGQDVLWHDVGDQKAREKASQCLRERTPDVMPFIKTLQKQSSTGTVINEVENKEKLGIPPGEFDASAVAVALLNKQIDGKENPLLNDYLQRMSEATDDDMSIDENASVSAIARALFKNVQKDDEMSIVDFLKSRDKMGGDLDSIFSETMSKCTWAQNINLDVDLMSAHSLGRVGNDEAHMPDFIPSFERNQKMKYAKSNASSMSMFSELTDKASDSGLNRNRAAKMAQGKKNSNVSMLSELTDMTGGFSNLEV